MSYRPFRTALAVLLGASLAAPAAIAAPATVSADLAAQSGHHTGKANLDGAVVVRRGSFLRAGLALEADTVCENPGMMLTDVATGATVRMPLLGREAGAALTRLNSDALAMRAQERCDNGMLAACGFEQDATEGQTLFGATLQGETFGTSVAISADGQYAVVSSSDKVVSDNKHPDGNYALSTGQYAKLVARSGTPFYTVVVERQVDPNTGAIRAALATWLPEDLPIGAYTLSLGCGQETIGEGLPLVVLFNPFDVTTAEVVTSKLGSVTQAGRENAMDVPGLDADFALSKPDDAAIDVLLELIAGFPLAARQHPALIAQIAAKGRGPIQLVRPANYASAAKGGGYDTDFLGGETNADTKLWAAVQAWNDATGHFDLWNGETMLGKVGDGAWPYAGAARVRVGHVLHTLSDSFAGGHTLRIVPPGAVTPAEAMYTAIAEFFGEAAAMETVHPCLPKNGYGPKVCSSQALNGPGSGQVKLQGQQVKGSNLKSAPAGGNAKYGQCWVFASTLTSMAKTDGNTPAKYGQCWVFSSIYSAAKAASGPGFGWAWGNAVSAASGDFERAVAEGSEAYTIAEYDGVQRSLHGVIPRTNGGLWTWTDGTWTGTGITECKGAGGGKGGTWTGTTCIEGRGVAALEGGGRGLVGVWDFDDSMAQDNSKMAVISPITLSGTGHFVDDWQGETAFLAFDVGSSGTRVTVNSTSGKTADPLAGIIFHKAGTAGAGVDGVTFQVASKDNPDKTITVGGTLLDSGSVFRAYRNGGRGVCHYGKCFCLSVVGEGLLRAAGIPTRSVTNFRIAVENPTFESPIGVANNSVLMRVGGKDNGAGLTWWNFAPYASMAVGKGEIEKMVSAFQSWNATAIKTQGESVWNFHVWTEVWVPASKLTTPQWNAFDATPQEESDGKVSMGPIWGLDCSQKSCPKDAAVHAAAKATGLPVDVVVESLFAGRRSPGELLHGRWDGKYDDGKTP